MLVVSDDLVEVKQKRGKWQFTGSHREANITKSAADDVALMVRKVILSLSAFLTTRTCRHVCSHVYILTVDVFTTLSVDSSISRWIKSS